MYHLVRYHGSSHVSPLQELEKGSGRTTQPCRLATFELVYRNGPKFAETEKSIVKMGSQQF